MKNKLGLVSLIVGVVSLGIGLFVPWESTIYDLIFGIISVIAIILGFVGKKALKAEKKSSAVAVIGIVIGFIGIAFYIFDFFLCYMIDNIYPNPELNGEICKLEYTTNCVDNGDGTSTCDYDVVTEIICKNEYLSSEQYK